MPQQSATDGRIKKMNLMNDQCIKTCISQFDSGSYTWIQLLRAVSHRQVRCLIGQRDRVTLRPTSRLAANFTAWLTIFVAYSRLSRDFRRGCCSSIGLAPSPLSVHIRTDSFKAWQRAFSLQTFLQMTCNA